MHGHKAERWPAGELPAWRCTFSPKLAAQAVECVLEPLGPVSGSGGGAAVQAGRLGSRFGGGERPLRPTAVQAGPSSRPPWLAIRGGERPLRPTSSRRAAVLPPASGGRCGRRGRSGRSAGGRGSGERCGRSVRSAQTGIRLEVRPLGPGPGSDGSWTKYNRWRPAQGCGDLAPGRDAAVRTFSRSAEWPKWPWPARGADVSPRARMRNTCGRWAVWP